MGDGGIGGNGSVEWTFVHHGSNGSLRNLIHKPGGGKPGDDEVKVDGNRATAKDAIPFADIGMPRPGAQDLVPGNFKVTLHYASPSDAAAALASAWVAGTSVVLYVPAVNREGKDNPNKDRPKEIHIEW